jgi:hypothetical protein
MEDEMYDKNEANEGREGLAVTAALKRQYPDYIDDPDGLERFRHDVTRNPGHDMAAVNYNSLGRLIDTIERLRRERDQARHRTTSLEAERPRASADAVGRERLRMFLEILSAAGGTSDAGDYPGSWINAFCETHEGRSPDTFNLAINKGYARSSHDSDTDHSVVYLTDAGRAILALHPPASDAAAVNLLLEWAEIEDRFVEEADEPADKGRSAVIAAEFRRAAKAISALSVEHPPVSDDAVPAGFVLVPVEPTQSMISAACDMLEGRGNVINIWSAMLAVANEARNDGTR